MRTRIQRMLPSFLAAMSIAIVALIPSPARAETSAAPPPIRPLVPCPNGDGGALDGPCASPMALQLSNDRILEAKTNTANAYVDSLWGVEAKNNLAQLEERLLALTGEAAPATQKRDGSLISVRGGQLGLRIDSRNLNSNFWVFEQVNSDYCGPATVESILNFLGPRQSQTRNALTGQFDRLTNDPQHDQQLLASDFWLSTDKNRGTNWGELYVPFTLNAWRGSRWYVLDATVAFDGTLTKDQALRNIRYDTDRGYPVAENVLYAPETYYPAGFWPGVRYQHWDVVYGLLADGAQTRVQVAQTYHDKRLPYGQYQNILWDVHWTSIEAWHGIVW